MKKYNFIAEISGLRLDVFVLDNFENIEDIEGVTRSQIKGLIGKGAVLVNNESKKAGYVMKVGDSVGVTIEDAREMDLSPANIPIDIVYEDDDIAVINKQQGLVVHPAQGSYDNTLVNALLFHLKNLSDINGVIRPGIVHRIDKNTSGLLVVAKTNLAHVSLSNQIATKQAKRFYIALVDGVVKADEGVINKAIARCKKDRKKMAVDDSGKTAITLYTVLKRYKNYTLMQFELKTGRTHQIRVHSKFIGHSIVGDDIYGGSNKFGLNGQLLHAFRLVLTHPKTNEVMTFEAPLPDYFKNVLESLQ